jgi:glucose/arabinose dehydrogenase
VNKKGLLFFLVLALLLGLGWFSKSQFLSSQEPSQALGYVAVDPAHYEVTLVAQDLVSPTRIKITPDGNYLLVSQITGEVLAFRRTTTGWEETPTQLTTVQTHFPGFPAEEGGLVGMTFSADYTQNGKLFLLYSYRDEKKIIHNQIAVTTLQVLEESLTASEPEIIFTANTPGNISHQITDGIGVHIQGKPHLLFLIGEGFKAERAQNPTQQAGKVMLIAEDGSNPSGIRPYPVDPKIQAIGLRNGYVLAQNSYLNETSVLLTDTGPDKYDRIISTQLFNAQGKAIKPINLGWTGDENGLAQAIPDPNNQAVSDMVLTRLPTTLTFTGLAFHPGKGPIPPSDAEKQSVLITVFGKTGSTTNEPGKEIWLGQLDSSGPSQLTTTPIIQRNPNAQNTLGNPVGLEIDPQTGNFFFADIFEGKLYQVIIK